jgi:hypothetical protein
MEEGYVAFHLIATVQDIADQNGSLAAGGGVDLDKPNLFRKVFGADTVCTKQLRDGWVVGEKAVPIDVFTDLNGGEDR